MDKHAKDSGAKAPLHPSDTVTGNETLAVPVGASARSVEGLGLWALAWPTMLSTLSMTLVRWADVKMVGELGVAEVAAVGAGGQLYWLIQTLAMALCVGLTALCARAVGAGDAREADQSLRQSLILGALLGVVTWLPVLPVREAMFGLMGLEASIRVLGGDYLFWMLIGNIPFTLAFVFAAALRAAGDTMTPLWISLLANVLNVFMNWLFIYGNWGMPEMGVGGAGLATSLSMFIQLGLFWWLWIGKKLVIVPKIKGFTADLRMWRRLFVISYPAAIEGFAFHIGLLAFLSVMAGFGSEEFAAYQVGVQILSISFMTGAGFSVASSTLVGQHLGAGQPAQAEKAGWRSAVIGALFMGALGVILIALSEPLARWFVDDDKVVGLTVSFVLLLGIVQPLMAVEFTVGGALRGAGDTRVPMLAVFFGLFLCRLMPAYIAATYFDAGIVVVWSFLIFDYLAKALILMWRYRQGVWKTIEV